MFHFIIITFPCFTSQSSMADSSSSKWNGNAVQNECKLSYSNEDSDSQSETHNEARLPMIEDHPYFTMIIGKSHLQKPYYLVVPRSFCANLPSGVAEAVFCIGKKRWELMYSGKSEMMGFFNRGWKEFAFENKLKIGDGCVFQLTDHQERLVFNVRVLDGSIPSS